MVTAWWRGWVRAGWSTSTAPAVTSAAAASPAAALVAIAPTLADRKPPPVVPITAVAPAAAVDPTAAAWPAAPAPDALEPAPAPAEWPMCRIANLRSSSSGANPIGRIAVSALLVSPSWPLKVEQRSHVRRWRRTSALGPAAQALGDLAQLDPDLLAGEHPRLGGLGERDTRADEQRLDARHGRLHRLGDLLVGQRVHLAQHERGALGLGKAVDVVDEQPELLALVDLVRRGGAVVVQVDVHRVDAHGLDPAQVVEAPVAGDPVQPGPHVDRAVVVEDRVEGRGEDLLQDVLGVLARAEQVPAEGEQARVVARDEHFEGGRAAAPDQRDEALIGLQPQEWRAGMQPDSSRVSKCRDFQEG